MELILSISLGSKTRDHQVEIEVAGKKFLLKRIGCDGDFKQARNLFLKYDQEVAAFGLGGINLDLGIGNKKYKIPQAHKLIEGVKSPVLDGRGLKATLEKEVINQVANSIAIKNKQVLLVSAIDRFGMAEAFKEQGANLLCGDLMFALKFPLVIRSLAVLETLARVSLPLISKLPFKVLYPTGEKQTKSQEKFSKYFKEAKIIAGDFHYIRYYSPEDLTDKIIITNTVTSTDRARLRKKGVKKLITTTPKLKGRCFGTNVIEALLTALSDKDFSQISNDDYAKLLDLLQFKPVIEELTTSKIS